ncbi:hypothetical protein [Streptomyces sp. NBC_00452]|uniref:hypothetical protein n=1 Tax=Streptomyces sp. NBC_00452 TaxID=2975746 RepID=UPI002B1DA4A2|nr:hypothetical protein [Streptomyces sp. NBC_00452]
MIREVDAFLKRAADEGLFRADHPVGWPGALLPQLMQLASQELPDLTAAQAADVVVDSLLRGFGAR